MAKLFFVLMVLFWGKISWAQASATAVATATIVQSVGAGEFVPDGLDNTALFSISPMQKTAGKNSPPEIKEIDFTTFRIVGAAFVYSLWAEPETAKNPPQKEQKKKLTNFTVKPSAGKAEAFVLGSLIDVALARKGAYDELTKLDVTIHFN